METTTFRTLIDDSRHAADGDPEQQLDTLAILLEALSPDAIVTFHRLFDAQFQASYTWPLWGAASVIGGGCSDDGFDDFWGWLSSRGELIFAAALAHPDSLASVVQDMDEDVDCQVAGWQSVAVDAWCSTAGRASSAFPFTPQGLTLTGPQGMHGRKRTSTASAPC